MKLSSPLQGPAARWGVAVALIAATATLNFPLQTLAKGRAPFLPMFPTLMAIGYLCGAGPAVLSLGICILAFATGWTQPVGTPWRISLASDVWSVAFFIGAAGVAIGIASMTRRLVLQATMARQRFEVALRGSSIFAWACDAERRPAGRLTGLVGASKDISDIHHTEEALRRSEALYRTLGEAAPDFVWCVDADGRAVHVNQRWTEYTGLTLEQLREIGWEAFAHPGGAALLRQKWSEAAGLGTSHEAEFRYRRKDGTYRWFRGRAAPLKDDLGRLTQGVGTSTDITDRQHAEDPLRLESRRKDAFIATLAHELRSSMAPIRYAAAGFDLHLVKPVDPEAVKEAVMRFAGSGLNWSRRCGNDEARRGFGYT